MSGMCRAPCRALFLFFAAGAVSAQAADGVVAASRYPGIEYASPDQSIWTTRVDARGEPDNPLFQVADALFAKAGIPWHRKTYPAARLFKNLQDGTSQFSMLVKAPSLQDCCLFSRKPIAVAEIRAYRLAGTALIKNKEDLVGKSVITIRGYSYGGLIGFLSDVQHRIAVNATQTHASAFRMLLSGRADYVIDYAGPATEVVAAERMDDVAFDVLSRQDIHLVLSKTYPDAPSVMVQLEAIAETLDVNGILGNQTASVIPKGSAPLAKPRPSR